MSDCIFCKDLPKVLENDLAYCLYDIKPITKGHMLFIPKRHHTTVFDSTPDEIKAMFELIGQAREMLIKEHKPDGFNIAANCGAAAGQIVMHAHIHLLPRYEGQPFNPRTLVH
ncbi:MAG: HIT family protein [Candidatus Omnitrophica bacterium]|nr:HIT family protein [Candidatus Omnitrophota bacterium]MDE2223415.1 HIT family protein [Candidatus Omnitrophota bacterium]